MSTNKGLEGVVVAETRLSMVDGQAGELIIGGFDVAELAMNATFEETVWLLWHGEMAEDVTPFRESLAERRVLPSATVELLRSMVGSGRLVRSGRRADETSAPLSVMDALRIAAGTISLIPGDEALNLVATFPTIVATYWHLLHDREPIAPRADLSHAANYLYMLNGEVPDAERVRGMETYLNTVIDHGLSASTFTARVITSTESDLVSAIVGALGAMKGPLHGGAPGPALDMVFEIGDASRAEEVLRRKIASGEKLMGFGHRVYKVRDPRADVLAAATERMFTRGGDMHLYELAKAVEATAVRLLAEYKPGRNLQTNVEFYTALLLHGLGLEVPLFTPTFSISRVAGWIAHALEQRKDNRIIRPQSVYIGRRGERMSPPLSAHV